MEIFNNLPVAFTWYDKIEKQNRYRENMQATCDYHLISPRDALLPFQFRKPTLSEFPTSWIIREVNTKNQVADLTASLGQLKAKSIGNYDYFYYGGAALPGLFLDLGYYESLLTYPSGYVAYSEMFYIPAQAFTVAQQYNSPYMRFEWYNNSDLPPIYYNDKVDGLPVFRNVVFLDSFVTASEPEVEEDGTKDGNDTTIPTFQKATIKYRVTDAVPDFLKLALVIMQMHDKVYMTTAHGVHSGEVTRLETNTSPIETGGMAQIDILFEQTVAMVKKGCANNMPLTEITPFTPTLASVHISGSNLVFAGNAPAGSAINIWAAAVVGGPYTKVSSYKSRDQLVAGTLTVAGIPGGYSWFKVEAFTFNQNFGLSGAKQKT